MHDGWRGARATRLRQRRLQFSGRSSSCAAPTANALPSSRLTKLSPVPETHHVQPGLRGASADSGTMRAMRRS
jgi:hypothetical protein